MTLFQRTPLDVAIHQLRADLVDENGPRISTMRNYRFALLVYQPEEEFALRQHAERLVTDLTSSGWSVLTISLQRLLFDRIRKLGAPVVDQLIEMERHITRANRAGAEPDRGLNFLRDQLAPLIEGPSGIAADVAERIRDHTSKNAASEDRTLVLVGRAGALYPFFRTSALLKHLDGRTGQVPVVLLYPGKRQGEAGLSFMDRTAPDRDYRPRIYG